MVYLNSIVYEVSHTDCVHSTYSITIGLFFLLLSGDFEKIDTNEIIATKTHIKDIGMYSGFDNTSKTQTITNIIIIKTISIIISHLLYIPPI